MSATLVIRIVSSHPSIDFIELASAFNYTYYTRVWETFEIRFGIYDFEFDFVVRKKNRYCSGYQRKRRAILTNEFNV